MAIGGSAPWSAKVMVKNTFLEFEYEQEGLRGEVRRRSLSVPPAFAASQRGSVMLVQCQREPGSTDLNIKKTPILDETFVDAIGLTAASLAESQLCSKDSRSVSRQSTEEGSTLAASEGTDNESKDRLADVKDGVSQSVGLEQVDSRPASRQSTEEAGTLAASEGTDNEPSDPLADFKDGASQSAGLEQAHRRSKARPRPCKQKRERLKRLTAELVQNSIANPEFDISRATLPPSLIERADLRGKVMRAVQSDVNRIRGLVQ